MKIQPVLKPGNKETQWSSSLIKKPYTEQQVYHRCNVHGTFGPTYHDPIDNRWGDWKTSRPIWMMKMAKGPLLKEVYGDAVETVQHLPYKLLSTAVIC